MQNAETVLDVLRERGRRGLPLDRLYRQLFNPQLYLLAYGRLYSNKGAMTPGATGETVDGMSLRKIEVIIEALRDERYRWSPVKRIHIPKKNGKTRPLGLPPWSDKALLLFLWVRFGGAAQGAGPLLPGQGRLRRRCREGAARPPGPASLGGPSGRACGQAGGLPDRGAQRPRTSLGQVAAGKDH
jgi:hypothetical protein